MEDLREPTMSHPKESRPPRLLSHLITLSSYGFTALPGAAACWFVAANSGPPTGTVVLHINAFDEDAEAVGGGAPVPIRAHTRDAVAVELPAGAYELIIQRGGRVLSQEAFELKGGEEVVLTAWQRPRAARHAPRPMRNEVEYRTARGRGDGA
jgi:hypothetical protein